MVYFNDYRPSFEHDEREDEEVRLNRSLGIDDNREGDEWNREPPHPDDCKGCPDCMGYGGMIWGIAADEPEPATEPQPEPFDGICTECGNDGAKPISGLCRPCFDKKECPTCYKPAAKCVCYGFI